ncbi:hypothetical protein R5R35_010773 [Gryllus longicercus]|uniref:Cytochrome P450 n=1 Tax=Gryllus longicercus TaxID=2509291 RepID=A0AAN9VJN5_9ORTH
MSELLRMYPPNATTDRVCQKDTILPATSTSKAIVVTKGTILHLPIIGLHMDSQYWNEPEKFDPERFNDENKHKIKPNTYVPFGVGPRICIGQRFALIEIKATLVHLFSGFDLHPSAKTEYPVRFKPGANLIARGGFWCGLSPREM